MHARQQIREELLTVLTGSTTAEDRVYSNRMQNMSEPELPAILIYTKEESAEREGTGRPAKQRRELSVAIELYVSSSTSNLDDEIDNLASEIEQILGTNYTLNNNCIDVKYSGINISVSNAGEKPIAVAEMDYTITYRINENNPNLQIY